VVRSPAEIDAAVGPGEFAGSVEVTVKALNERGDRRAPIGPIKLDECGIGLGGGNYGSEE